MKKKVLWFCAFSLIAALILSAGAAAQTGDAVSLLPGDKLTINCDGDLFDDDQRPLTVICIGEEAAATNTPNPTNTAIPLPPTVTPEPTATEAAVTPTIPPISGEPCPAWVHNGYVAVGPDGNEYPTWHPPVDPVYGCYFDHEHGVEPAAGQTRVEPLFGYIGAVGGFSEPHAGFKVFTFECGASGDQGPNQFEAVVVMHMGTSGQGMACF
jgi:hypothetical protein